MFHQLVLVILLLASVKLFAATESSVEITEPSTRVERRFGFIIGLNDPVPALVGINVAFNAFDFLRLTAGAGRFTSEYDYGMYKLNVNSVTYGAGVRFLVPGWNLSPVAGASWATISSDGFPENSNHVYAAIGVEWQSWFGLNVGAGYNQSSDSRTGGLPYLDAGWYF